MSLPTDPMPYVNDVQMNEELGDEDLSQMSSLSSFLTKEQPITDENSKPQAEDGKERELTTVSGVDEACDVVKAILEQVTFNDSPPVNDELPPLPSVETPKRKRLTPRFGASQASVTTKSTGGSSYTRPSIDTLPRGLLPISRQQHAFKPFEDSKSETSSLRGSDNGSYMNGFVQVSDGQSLEGTSTISSVGMENASKALWMEHYRKSQTRSETKMGNAALATLCSRTLDSVSLADNAGTAEDEEYVDQPEEGFDARENDAVFESEFATNDKTSAETKPPHNTKARISKKRWFARRLGRKKRGSIPAELEVQGTVSSSSSSDEDSLIKSEDAHLEVQDDEDLPFRDVDNLPPTPVRTNIKRLEGSKFFDENADWASTEKSQDTDDVSLDAIETMRSGDSEESNVIVDDADLELSPSDEIPEIPPHGTMEHIQEETEAEIAREESGEAPRSDVSAHREKTTLNEEKSKVKNNRRPPMKASKYPQQGRIQMYGSEYARFLSSTPFSPQIAHRHRSQSRSSSSVSSRTSSLICRPGSTRSSGVSSKTKSVNIEDANSSILTGAITDILVTHGTDLPPRGYFRISQSGSGDAFGALSGGTQGTAKSKKHPPVFLNVKKEPSWDKAAQRPCVTALTLIFPDRKEFVPPGFCVVRRYSSPVETSENMSMSSKNISKAPANLNHGSSDERIYLCYRRSREGNPLTGIIPLLPSKGEAIPEGYTVLERTPRNFVADMSSQAGFPVFLAFRQRLANLETLRPLPLVLSVHYSKENGSASVGDTSLEKKKLQAYYCTGGTVVSSKVGRFHIMDRSTHSLLSPSSVSNRISLIEASRRQHSSIDCADIPRTSTSITYASSVDPLGQDTRGHLMSSHTASVSDYGLLGDGSVLTNASSSFLMRSAGFEVNSASKPKDHSRDHSFSSMSELTLNDIVNGDDQTESVNLSQSSLPSRESMTLQGCLDAMDFIPVIKEGENPSQEASVFNERKPLQSRIAVLTPILTACYTHHGGSAIVAVEGLQKLLTTTDFFQPDVNESQDAENGTSSRLTLLDLAVQSVCDVATASSRETSFAPCVEFVDSAIRYSKGRLNTRTIGYAIRFYLFVFYFGASVPTATSSWPLAQRYIHSKTSTGLSSCFTDDVPLLQEDGSFLSGGAPQASALALKELISLSLDRLRSLSSVERNELGLVEIGDKTESSSGFVHNVLLSLTDGAVHHFDLANYTQLALHQMHRSGGSELFWHDMISSCGPGLFSSDELFGQESQQVYIMSFAIMANLVKVSSTNIRRMSRSQETVPRDLSSKLLSMELLTHFLERWGQEQSNLLNEESSVKSMKSVNTLAYAIRRLVVPCLLWNTASGLENSLVFRRIIRMISALWRIPCYRRTLKMELGVLIEHFIVRVLQLGPHLLPSQEHSEPGDTMRGHDTMPFHQSHLMLSHQAEILEQLTTWFVVGKDDMLEVFLNFDLDFSPGENKTATSLMPGPQWKICQELCAALCTIMEKSGDIIGEQIRLSQTTGAGPPTSPRASLAPKMGMVQASVREGGRLLQHKASEVLTSVAKSLAESAAVASGPRYRHLVTSWSSLDEEENVPQNNHDTFDDDESTTSSEHFEFSSPISRLRKNEVANRSLLATPHRDCRSPRSRSHSPMKQGEMFDYWQNSIAPERKKAMMSPRGRSLSPHRQPQTPETSHNHQIPASAPAKTMKPVGDKRGTNSNDDTPSTQTQVPNAEETLDIAFKLVKEKSLNKAIEYLVASNFLTPSPREIASFLRIHSSKMDSEVLGNYLGDGGKDGADVEYKNLIRFNYVRAISFVGMNIEEGLRYFLTNCGFRLPGEAQKIDRIMTTFSQCYWEDNAGDIQRCPFQDQDTIFLLSFAIIMLNTDLHKIQLPTSSRVQRKRMTKTEFLSNLRGVDNAEELTRDYLSTIYDSIEAEPIAIIQDMNCGTFPTTPVDRGEEGTAKAENILNTQLKSIIHSVKPAEELLRGLSVHDNPLYTVEAYCYGTEGKAEIVKRNLVKKAWSSTWYLFHGLINSTLEKAHLDSQGMECCLDVLKYAICATICLDMTMERSAFVTQLARLKVFAEKRDTWFGARSFNSYKLDDWYIDLEMDCSDPLDEKAKLNALVQVNSIFNELHEALKVDTGIAREMHRAIRQIRNGGFLLNDPYRSFVREGDMMKRANRSGRTSTYRFFLFSDVLIYAKKTSEDDYKVHEEFPLYLMKITDYFPSSGGSKKYLRRSFEVHHPHKSFLVVAASLEEKREWVVTLREAIENEIQRKARLESARLTSSLHQWG